MPEKPEEPQGPAGGVVGVVVAAGASTRFGGSRPKQFEDLAGLTVVERAARALLVHPAVEGVVVVLPREDLAGAHARHLAGVAGILKVVAGGATRAESVTLGVEAAQPAPFVIVHDAARPFVSAAVVAAVVEGTLRHGAAVPVVPVVDTVKEESAAGFVSRTVDRGTLRLAQTPQGARSDWLLVALRKAKAEGVEVTDESQALERMGYEVATVPGDRENRKITGLGDLEEARRRGVTGQPRLRVGIGFDIHRFAAAGRLVLGGIEFPGETGLSGHSDADVVLHAAMDAILGALGQGDIGAHFPPDDPRFAGASSAGLLRQVAARAAAEGFEVVNLDLSLMAERPRIRDRVDEMRRAIADCLGIDASRVGVKATTLEGLGALGRAEGIACQAVVLLSSSVSS